MKRPDKVWMAYVNLGGGLHTQAPHLATWYEGAKGWYTKGDLGTEKLGLNKRSGCITYTSTDKAKVRIFCEGAKALRDILLSHTLQK